MTGLQVVKLLTALSYCVGGSFVFVCVSAFVLGSLSLLSDACQRTNLTWWAVGYRSVGVDKWVNGLLGASFYHHQHHPPPTFPR